MIKTICIIASLLLTSLMTTACGSYTTAAMVRTSKGETLTGTTTAALTGGTFVVRDSGSLACSGTYDALDRRPTISAPLTGNDGRTGVLTVTRTPDGLSGSGTANLSDGTTANVGFGSLASNIIAPEASTLAAPAARTESANLAPTTIADPKCYVGPSGGTYTITRSGKKNYSGCTSAQASSLIGTPAISRPARIQSSRTCFVGPRGGTYTITRSGRKNYGGC